MVLGTTHMTVEGLRALFLIAPFLLFWPLKNLISSNYNPQNKIKPQILYDMQGLLVVGATFLFLLPLFLPYKAHRAHLHRARAYWAVDPASSGTGGPPPEVHWVSCLARLIEWATREGDV